jgi:hypothetical protein
MLERGRRDDKIRLREGMLGFASILDQQSPLEHHVFGEVSSADRFPP